MPERLEGLSPPTPLLLLPKEAQINTFRQTVYYRMIFIENEFLINRMKNPSMLTTDRHAYLPLYSVRSGRKMLCEPLYGAFVRVAR